jgi:diguanylate cyclase (GGDEF)-like protein/PAS domain S-box-containing protein
MTKDTYLTRQLNATKNIATASVKGDGQLSVLRAVTSEITETLGYGRVFFGLIDKRSSRIRIRIGGEKDIDSKNFTKKLRSLPPISLEKDDEGRVSAIAWSFLTGETIIVNNADSYDFRPDETFQDNELVTDFDFTSYIITPLHFRNESLGVIIVDNKYIHRKINEKDTHLISTVADQLSVAIVNANMFRDYRKSNRELIEINKKLIQEQKKYQQLVERGTDPIFIIQDYLFVFVNRAFSRMLGYSEEEILGTSVFDLVIKESRQELRNFYEKGLQGHSVPEEYEYRARKKDGSNIDIWMKTTFTRYNDRLGILCFARDTTERKRVESELIEAKEYLEKVLESANDIIYILDLQGRFTYVNPKCEELGYRRKKLIGKHFLTILSDKHTGERFCKTIEEGIKQVYEVEMLESDGETIHNVVISSSPLYDRNNKIEGILIVGKDITDRKIIEEELRRLSITDSLTGLFNQRHFYFKLKEEVDRAKRMKHSLCLMIIDINNFKKYNDAHGHLAGDEILRTIGDIIKKSIREDVDSAFRYGGDEFSIILPYITVEHAKTVGERIKGAIVSCEKITVSIGVATLEDTWCLEDFIHTADMAMYTEKHTLYN